MILAVNLNASQDKRYALERRGVRGDFVETAQETRCCLAMLTNDGASTEILEPGPEIAPAELAAFAEKYASLAAGQAVLFGRERRCAAGGRGEIFSGKVDDEG